jgi:hypothetical protein
VSLPYIVTAFKDTITPVGKVMIYTLQTYGYKNLEVRGILG